jgi:cytoplasmic iron level regulating protein YaaA (DUF328/UPF0246 family)
MKISDQLGGAELSARYADWAQPFTRWHNAQAGGARRCNGDVYDGLDATTLVTGGSANSRNSHLRDPVWPVRRCCVHST